MFLHYGEDIGEAQTAFGLTKIPVFPAPTVWAKGQFPLLGIQVAQEIAAFQDTSKWIYEENWDNGARKWRRPRCIASLLVFELL